MAQVAEVPKVKATVPPRQLSKSNWIYLAVVISLTILWIFSKFIHGWILNVDICYFALMIFIYIVYRIHHLKDLYGRVRKSGRSIVRERQNCHICSKYDEALEDTIATDLDELDMACDVTVTSPLHQQECDCVPVTWYNQIWNKIANIVPGDAMGISNNGRKISRSVLVAYRGHHSDLYNVQSDRKPYNRVALYEAPDCCLNRMMVVDPDTTTKSFSYFSGEKFEKHLHDMISELYGSKQSDNNNESGDNNNENQTTPITQEVFEIYINGASGFRIFESTFEYYLKYDQWPTIVTNDWEKTALAIFPEEVIGGIKENGCYLKHEPCDDTNCADHSLDWVYSFPEAEMFIFQIHSQKPALWVSFDQVYAEITSKVSNNGGQDAAILCKMQTCLKQIFLIMADFGDLAGIDSQSLDDVPAVIGAFIKELTRAFQDKSFHNYFLSTVNIMKGVTNEEAERAVVIIIEVKDALLGRVTTVFNTI